MAPAEAERPCADPSSSHVGPRDRPPRSASDYTNRPWADPVSTADRPWIGPGSTQDWPEMSRFGPRSTRRAHHSDPESTSGLLSGRPRMAPRATSVGTRVDPGATRRNSGRPLTDPRSTLPRQQAGRSWVEMRRHMVGLAWAQGAFKPCSRPISGQSGAAWWSIKGRRGGFLGFDPGPI